MKIILVGNNFMVEIGNKGNKAIINKNSKYRNSYRNYKNKSNNEKLEIKVKTDIGYNNEDKGDKNVYNNRNKDNRNISKETRVKDEDIRKLGA